MGHPAFPTDERGWSAFLPPRKPSTALEGTHRANWVVIGAGFTGLAAARRLAELHPHESIILLDARQVGQGASGRNSGYAVAFSQPGGFDREKIDNYRRLNRINSAGLSALKALVRQHGIDCDWHDSGFYHAAADRRALQEAEHFATYLDALEIPHEALDRDAASARLGTRHYRKAFHILDGALVQPAALVRGLAASLPGNVALHEETPVLSIDGAGPLTLTLPRGTVTADKVILAVNFEASKLGYLGDRLTGSTLSGSFTRKLTDEEYASIGSPSVYGVLSLHYGGATVRLTGDRRICLRNTAEFTNSQLLDDATLARRQKIHRDSFERRFPQLAHVEFEHAWSGVEGISRNMTNFFAKVGKGIWYAGGYNGSGVSRGTAFGSAIADHASGAISQLVSDCLASAPAGWLPPRPLLDIGAAWKVAERFRGVGADH